jgi:hypothetical protein
LSREPRSGLIRQADERRWILDHLTRLITITFHSNRNCIDRSFTKADSSHCCVEAKRNRFILCAYHPAQRFTDVSNTIEISHPDIPRHDSTI